VFFALFRPVPRRPDVDATGRGLGAAEGGGIGVGEAAGDEGSEAVDRIRR
jgi:hypothetical protein